jgi:PhnB protein
MKSRAKAKAKPKARAVSKRRALPIPAGFHTLTPYLVVRDAAKAVEFYQKAFGAKVRSVHKAPDGKVMNADLKIGDSILMFSDEFPGLPGAGSPQTLGGTSVTIHIYVKDVDALFNQALGAGAQMVMPVMDAFWGDRYGQLQDPFGHRWSIATHKEDLTPAEIERRGEAAFAEMAKKAQAAGSDLPA